MYVKKGLWKNKQAQKKLFTEWKEELKICCCVRDSCSSWLTDQSLHNKLVFKMADLVAVQSLTFLHTCSGAHSAFRSLKYTCLYGEHERKYCASTTYLCLKLENKFHCDGGKMWTLFTVNKVLSNGLFVYTYPVWFLYAAVCTCLCLCTGYWCNSPDHWCCPASL